MLKCSIPIFTAITMVQASTNPSSATLHIDTTTLHQNVEGFGASGCWTAQLTGEWPEASRRRALDLLFTDQGAGLSIWRYNLGAGGGAEIKDPSRRATSVEVTQGQYDLSRDQAALDVVRGAVERGVSRIVVFVVSLPERFMINGLVSGGDDGAVNLKPESEPDAATYVTDITLLLKRQLKLEDVRLSPMNEPQWTWGGKAGRRQEGCHMLPDQLARLSNAVAQKLQAQDPSILMEGPEGGQWHGTTFSYIQEFLKYPDLVRQLGALAIHSYWSDDDARREFMRRYEDAGLNIPIAQTEWCDMQWQRDAGMHGAFTLYRTMHSDLTLCNVVSWTFWLALSNYDYRDGLIYIEKDHTLTPSKRLSTMGHFSRFVKPGAVRVASRVSDERLLTTSYLSKDRLQVVTVIANPTDEVFGLSLETVEADLDPLADLYVTDEERDLARQQANLASVAIPPQSIVTVVAHRK